LVHRVTTGLVGFRPQGQRLLFQDGLYGRVGLAVGCGSHLEGFLQGLLVDGRQEIIVRTAPLDRGRVVSQISLSPVEDGVNAMMAQSGLRL
jgi:hypothetical protein